MRSDISATSDAEDELRRLARRHMARERAGHTLQATALVNEACLRLIEVNQVQWQNAHIFSRWHPE